MVKLSGILEGDENMENGRSIQIADNIHGTLGLNSMEKEVISTPIFNRLHNILQNSTVYLTFPANRTKRFEHSIGTMDICGKMFFYAISNASKDNLKSFFDEVEIEIDKKISFILESEHEKYRNIIGDENLVLKKLQVYKEHKLSNEYNCFIPSNVEEKYRLFYVIIYQSIRMTALLHDVGHPPFSHITESALKDILKELKLIEDDKKNKRQKRYIKIIEKYFGEESEHQLHEEIGNSISDKVFETIIGCLDKSEYKDKKALSEILFKLIIKEVTIGIFNEKNNLYKSLHRIVDGALDGDRLDYVSRDPINSGLNLGVIEYERIVKDIRLIKFKKNNKKELGHDYLFCVPSKALDSVEDFFNRRWKLYKQIIFHHRVIKTDYLLQCCIKEISIKYLKSNEEEEELGNSLPYNISGLWLGIEHNPSNISFFNNLIQWDDNWLMTVLKKHYFEEYVDIDENQSKEDKILGYKLCELLSNKKYYYSLIKRSEDFIGIDKSVAKIMNDEYNDIIESIKKVEQSGNKSKSQSKAEIEINPYLNRLEAIFNKAKEYCDDYNKHSQDGFIVNEISKIIPDLSYDSITFKEVLEKVKNDLIEERVCGLEDIVMVIKELKTGIQESLVLYSKDDEENIVEFNKRSKESKLLLQQKDLAPAMYIYVLKDTKFINYEDLKRIIGEKIGKIFLEVVKDQLKVLQI